jgi:fibronectin type 3 domain-containing protein
MPKLLRWLPPLLLLALPLAGCNKKADAPASVRSRSVALHWDASTSPVRGYHVYRATDADREPGLLAVTPADAIQYVDRTVQPGRTYFYTVNSVGLDGTESLASEQVAVTIPAD